MAMTAIPPYIKSWSELPIDKMRELLVFLEPALSPELVNAADKETLEAGIIVAVKEMPDAPFPC